MSGPTPQAAGGGTPFSKLKSITKTMIGRFTPTDTTRELLSYDYREVEDFVPVGNTATPHGLKDPNARTMSHLEVWTVVAPGVGESTLISIYRVRGIGGFSFTLVAPPFTLDAASFAGAGIAIDLTPTLFDDCQFQSGDFIACSWVHAGTQAMKPLNTNWRTSPKLAASNPPPALIAPSWPP